MFWFAAVLPSLVIDDHPLRAWLADTITRVRLNGFHNRELFRTPLPFRHPLKYGILLIVSVGGVSPAPGRWAQAMEEKDFFEEKSEQRKHTLTCPHCGKAEEYEVAWLVRRKKTQLPGRPDERDRARFAKAQSYMVRKDDVVGCKNIRCRKRFEVSSLQTVAFI
jgi:hypothetical protein